MRLAAACTLLLRSLFIFSLPVELVLLTPHIAGALPPLFQTFSFLFLGQQGLNVCVCGRGDLGSFITVAGNIGKTTRA